MKNTFTILITMLSLISMYSQVRYDLKFTFEGRNRECIIVKPSTPPPAGGYPVVFMLHGTSGDGEKFYNISGWKELGEKENFITVFPSSLSWCFEEYGVEKRNTKWVCGDLIEKPCATSQNYVDDVKFLKRIVAMINDTVPMNASKVFACGFSNGSSMIHKLSMDAGDVFAAVAGSSSGLDLLDSINPPLHRIPIWFMVGTLDDGFIVPPYTELPYDRDTILFYLKGSLNRAISCQGLTSNFTFVESTYSHTYIFDESQNGGKSSSPYIFTLNKGQTHEFPNGTNFPVDAPKLFWDFFNNSLPVSTEAEWKEEELVELYPNPSNDFVNLVIKNNQEASKYKIRVMNSFGQIVFEETKNQTSEIKLRKEKFGSGFYFVQVESGNKRDIKKLIFY
jgi:polyhydroxybutyrate depolymerase